MRVLTAKSDAPSHIVLTQHPADFWRIQEPEVNLVACFLKPSAAFNNFAHDARRFDMDEHYVINHQAPVNQPEYSIDQQMQHVFAGLTDQHEGLRGMSAINRTLRHFIGGFCAVTEADELSVRLRAKIGDDMPTVKPHIDAIVDVRGLADFSGIGMACFDQTGLSPEDVRLLSRKTYGVDNFAKTEQTFTDLNDRLLLVKGPVLMMFKGLQSNNPLLHATIPQALMTDEQRATPFRPCWRLDSYYR